MNRIEQYCIEEGLLQSEKTIKYKHLLETVGYTEARCWFENELAEIEKYTERIYSEVETFEDLLDTNILYFLGKIMITFDHLSPIFDMNTENLIILHQKLRFYTTNGQSGGIGVAQGPSFASEKVYDQKAYLEGIILKDYAPYIIELMKNDYDIHCVSPSGETIYTNIPEAYKKCYPVTLKNGESYSKAWPNELCDDMNDTVERIGSTQIIDEIEDRCFYLLIISRKFTPNERIEDSICNRSII